MVGLVFCYVGPGRVPCRSARRTRGSRFRELSVESSWGHRGLGAAGLTAVDLAGGRVGYSIAVVEVSGRCVALHRFPALSVIDFHPVIFAILNLAGALKGLREQLTQVVVIGSVLEAEVTDVAQVLVEFL